MTVNTFMQLEESGPKYKFGAPIFEQFRSRKDAAKAALCASRLIGRKIRLTYPEKPTDDHETLNGHYFPY